MGDNPEDWSSVDDSNENQEDSGYQEGDQEESSSTALDEYHSCETGQQEQGAQNVAKAYPGAA